ncbi:peptide MFS transporter [Leptospira sp. 2 VSF19]|uniref:Peptide MFS transporter n=1 Tax=Leptospira soteropolitanensis TaxID=2950025 RepID=A0AAW5VNM5_9LEPT|nr:peptide MFS transporter [Leptospira soteropolitanensis]MCW7492020.1 peptide MFS transporter [Leptospira soteropolitanensis]MCW7499602.1 peptide MFS transporter [Leptospira soteropolitanensis]MCW7521853.1 peptide MFS transporter [Leptospira soteropolitanensis]MCW7525707.1 peptide MFS transporter [Leptospira soteropolitanensis]MCW7530179.1 peptide MFS transporter [Leptospira soteropolitanensis]
MEKQNETQLNRHPRGITPLFLTEMWERLSYYGMRALLVLYLVKSLGFSDADAGAVYAFYTSFVYLTPVIGGYLTDRFLSYQFAIYLGSFLMLCGHISLAFSGLPFFYLGLVLLALGNGFFKPNMSTIFGRLYNEKQNLRDSGFTIFYMGINLGGLLGPIICGSLGERVDWHLGFLSAGVGMAVGMIVFYFGSRRLPDSIWEKQSSLPRTSNSSSVDKKTQSKILLIVLLSFFSIFFWMAFEQMGSSLNLFALRNTDRNLFGFNIPASVLQSINPLFILLFGPIVSLFWTALSKRNKNPNPVLKFVLSLVLLGIGFLVMVVAASFAETGVSVSILFLVFVYFWNTLSELCLSPVGLSFVSQMAPAQYASLLMGIWFLSNAFGHYAAGILSGYQNQWGSMKNFYGFFVICSFSGALLLYGIYSIKKKTILGLLEGKKEDKSILAN